MAAKLVQIRVWVLCGNRGGAADSDFLGFSVGNLVGLQLVREIDGFELIELIGLGELRIGKMRRVRYSSGFS